MKRIVPLAFALVLVVPALAGEGHDAGAAWFDMTNCDFCKHLAGAPGLMNHVTWENHAIDDGMLSITTVTPEYRDAFHEANRAMHELGQKMMSGQIDPRTVKMCGHCQAFGGLMMQGAQMKVIQSEQADVEVTLVTSGDPAVVAKIHEFNDRNDQEMNEYVAEHDEHEHH